MNLPFLISVPHAGLTVPAEVKEICTLTEDDITKDGDEGASEVYALENDVRAFVTTEIARAIVDQNRAPNDIRTDGVVKTETCWDVPIYRRPLTEAEIARLLEDYYYPYHRQLSEKASEAVLGIDCHTMAAVGPRIGPMAGKERPKICLSNDEGTCPKEWFDLLSECLDVAFELEVSRNHPFRGGYIIREHFKELPWVQLELSRRDWISNEEKRERLLQGLGWFARRISA